MNMWLLFRMAGDGSGAPAPMKVVAVKRSGEIAPAAPRPVA